MSSFYLFWYHTVGREQAELTAKRLQELDVPLKKIVNSSMNRAKQTADVIAQMFPTTSRESCDCPVGIRGGGS